MRQLEAEILRALKAKTGKNYIRQKDIMEWSTGTVKAESTIETVTKLEDPRVSVAWIDQRVKPNGTLKVEIP